MPNRIHRAQENEISVFLYVFAEVLILHCRELNMLSLHIVPFDSRMYSRINLEFL